MTAKTASLFNMEPQHMLAAGAVGLGVGAGTRTLKNLWDMWQDRDVNSAVAGKMPKQISNHAQIPVTVTPEEAKELEAQGVHVKAAVDLSFLDKFALGAAGTGAAALGWHALDGTYDNQRMSLAQTKLENARKRVKSLLAGSYEPQDSHIGEAMKVAEDAMIKEAWPDIMGSIGEGVNNALGQIPMLGYAAGGGAALVAAGAFNEARKRNKSLNNSKAMAEYERAQPTKPPVAELVPVMGKIGALLRESEVRAAARRSPDYKERIAKLRERRGELAGRLDGRPA